MKYTLAIRNLAKVSFLLSVKNHCFVARKIKPLWHRQQCGYECEM